MLRKDRGNGCDYMEVVMSRAKSYKNLLCSCMQRRNMRKMRQETQCKGKKKSNTDEAKVLCWVQSALPSLLIGCATQRLVGAFSNLIDDVGRGCRLVIRKVRDKLPEI